MEKKNFNCNYWKLLPVDCSFRIHKFDGNRVCLVLMKDYFYREVENLEFLFKEMDDKVNFVSRNLPIFLLQNRRLCLNERAFTEVSFLGFIYDFLVITFFFFFCLPMATLALENNCFDF